MARDPLIDTIILGCTHYPLLLEKIRQYLPDGTKFVTQGNYVADSLRDYLLRHPEMDVKCTKGSSVSYYTTDTSDKFSQLASLFLQEEVDAKQIKLEKI
jgi:glutamate racemase